MTSLSIGLSGLQVSQRLMDMTGNNIANAGTPGFHREVPDIAAQEFGNENDMGVMLRGINRVINQALETALIHNTSAASGTGSELDGLTQLQSYLAPGTGSLDDA